MQPKRGPVRAIQNKSRALGGEMNGTFNPIEYKNSESRLYSGIAGSYHQYAPKAFGGFIEPLMEMAGLQKGQRVLDLGTGTGQVALAAARLVGDSGKVIGLDIAPGLIKKAKEQAEISGLSWVEFVQGDAEQLHFADESFDIVLCHFGLMHFPDRDKALTGMQRVLKKGGRVVLSVWSTSEKMRVLGIVTAKIKEVFPEIIQPGAPGWFDFGSLGSLEVALSKVGFKNIKTMRLNKPLTVQDAEAYWRILTGVSGRLQVLLEKIPAEIAARIETETKQAAQSYQSSNGLSIPCEAVIGTGIK